MSVPLSSFLLKPQDRVRVCRIEFEDDSGPRVHYAVVPFGEGAKWHFFEYLAKNEIDIGPSFIVFDGKTSTEYDTDEAFSFIEIVGRVYDNFVAEFGEIDVSIEVDDI